MSSANLINNSNNIELHGINASSKFVIYNKNSSGVESETASFTESTIQLKKPAQMNIIYISDVYNSAKQNAEILQYNGDTVFTNYESTGSISFRTKNGSTFSDYMKLSSTQCLFNLNLKSTGNLLLSSANIINNANTIEIRGNNASSKLSIFNKDSSNNESETAGFTNDLIYLNKQSQINGTLNMLGNNIINTGSINTSSLTASNLTIDKIGSTTNIKVGNNLSFKYGLCAYLISSTGQTIPISFSMTKLPAQVVNNVYRIILMPNYKVVGYDLEFYGGSSVSFGYSELKTQDPLNPIVPIFFNGWNSSSTPMNLKVNEFVNWEIYSMKCYYNDGTSLIEMTVPFISDGTTSIY
jgi:hypothetical protein